MEEVVYLLLASGFLRAGRAVERVGFEGVTIAGQMDFRRVADDGSAVAVRVAKVQPHTVSRAYEDMSLGNEGSANLRYPRIIVNGHFFSPLVLFSCCGCSWASVACSWDWSAVACTLVGDTQPLASTVYCSPARFIRMQFAASSTW